MATILTHVKSNAVLWKVTGRLCERFLGQRISNLSILPFWWRSKHLLLPMTAGALGWQN